MSYDVIDVLSVHQQRQFVEALYCSLGDKTGRLRVHERQTKYCQSQVINMFYFYSHFGNSV